MTGENEKDALLGFIEAISMAAKYAWQMAHHQENPAWLQIRDLLETTKSAAISFATSKPVPRQKVLEMMARRKWPANTK